MSNGDAKWRAPKRVCALLRWMKMTEKNDNHKNSNTLNRFKKPLDYSRIKAKNSPFLSGWIDENANSAMTPEKHAEFVKWWKEEIKRLLKGNNNEEPT